MGTTPFITTWKTDNPGLSNSNQITIPTFGSGYNYTVDWGDATTSTHTGDAIHIYAIPGTYTVSITGAFPQIYYNNAGDKDKIIAINQWGDNQWQSMKNAFSGCSFLQGNFTDNPDLSQVKDMSGMFKSATLFNHKISNWDVSSVEDMSEMFAFATSFNQNIGNWDVGKVTSMLRMFKSATVFNQNIGSWNVSNVVTTQNMFELAKSFNQDIGNWNVGKVAFMSGMFQLAESFNQNIGKWDVSNVTEMNGMFNAAISFNQDIGKWNISSVKDIGGMFDSATSFDQNLGSWDVSKINFLGNMFYQVTLSVANYDALLIGWNSQILKLNVPFDGGNSKYCTGKSARDTMTTTNGWLISDGGFVGPLIDDISDNIIAVSYKLPIITGTSLIGNEAYYTGTKGTGTKFSAGDVINYFDFTTYPITLFLYGATTLSCNDEQNFKLTITTLPVCTSLLVPLSGATNVALGTNLTWNSTATATGYKLTVGTSLLATDILNTTDVGNVLTYNLPTHLPENTVIFVGITPYNTFGDAIACSREKFTTETKIVQDDLPPKFFTPNNDGINDFWKVPNLFNTIISISIYDRYSKLLKQIAGNSSGWDGRYIGATMPADDYWYLINYKDGKVLQGHFSLKR